MKSSFKKSVEYLGWKNTDHLLTDLKMEENKK